MKLVPVYGNSHPHAVNLLLYALLSERTPEQSISHKQMPTFAEHCAFVASQPYMHWYLIQDEEHFVGSIYLTHNREVGLFIFSSQQGKGYGSWALKEFRKLHPGRLLANIAPTNASSRRFFEDHGAKLLQFTYEL